MRVIFKDMIEDLEFYNGDHETAQAGQKEDGKKNTIGAESNADNMVKVKNFHPSYVC